MIRILPVLLLFLCLPIFSSGQNLQRIDSLSNLLPQQHGADLFDVLNEIAWEYRFINQDSTIQYAQRAFSLGRKLGFKKKLGKPLNYIGVAHEYKDEAIEAYDYYRQALLIATSQSDELEIAYANNNAGRLFFDQGNVIRSLEHYTTALKLFEHTNDSIGIAYVYLNLAQLYQFQKNFKKAEEHFKKVYQIRLRLNGAPNVSSLLQLGIFYREAGNLAKSNNCFRKADSLCVVRKDRITQSEVSILLAENLFKEGKYIEANALADRGFSYAQQYKLTNNLSSAHLLKGKIYFEMNELEKAKDNFNQVISHSKINKDISLKMDAHYYLGQIYSRQGQMEYELRNKNSYLILRDSIKAKDLAKQIERLKFQFNLEIEQREKENALLKEIDVRKATLINKQKTINVIYAIVTVIVVVIAILLYRSMRMKQRHNAELANKQEEIMRQSEELRTSNLEIEKINANLEFQVRTRTKKIKDQNELLTEYAYFNAHQVRGPLARILGLISVLHLEFNRKDFGPYIDMLRQAGTELDDAIKNINEQLDGVDIE
jgi:tetratricopeptide (TPR) repeat protein